jgi:pimeloyl-ACP methyl ester carboxylesterase
MICLIRGKNFGAASPLMPLVDSLTSACPGVPLLVRDWDSKFDVADFGLSHRVLLIAHSFGGHTAMLIAAALNDRLLINFDLILLDPVRHAATDNPDDPAVLQENPLAQLFDRSPFHAPANVIAATCYLRTDLTPIPPYHSPLALDRAGLVNVHVPSKDGQSSDHNGVVALVADEIVARARGIFVAQGPQQQTHAPLADGQ